MEDGDTYRLLHVFFNPALYRALGSYHISPEINLSRPYQPEPEGRVLIRSEGSDQGWDQKKSLIIFLSYTGTYACKRANKIIYQFPYFDNH